MLYRARILDTFSTVSGTSHAHARVPEKGPSVEVLGLVLGGLGVVVPIAIAIWQAHKEKARRARRRAKKDKAELEAAKKRLAELERAIQQQSDSSR